jgi:hypothetical protein
VEDQFVDLNVHARDNIKIKLLKAECEAMAFIVLTLEWRVSLHTAVNV